MKQVGWKRFEEIVLPLSPWPEMSLRMYGICRIITLSVFNEHHLPMFVWRPFSHGVVRGVRGVRDGVTGVAGVAFPVPFA